MVCGILHLIWSLLVSGQWQTPEMESVSLWKRCQMSSRTSSLVNGSIVNWKCSATSSMTMWVAILTEGFAAWLKMHFHEKWNLSEDDPNSQILHEYNKHPWFIVMVEVSQLLAQLWPRMSLSNICGFSSRPINAHYLELCVKQSERSTEWLSCEI